MRRAPRPRRHEPGIARSGLEQHDCAGRSDRFEIEVGAQPVRDLAIGHERRRAHQPALFAVGDQRQQRPLPPARRGKHARRFQRHRDAERIVGRARRVGRRVVVGDEPERVRLARRAGRR